LDPRFVEWALTGRDLEIYGTGDQARCFCHVSDVVRALILLMDSTGSYGEVFNVGNTEEISIRSLAERVIDRTGSKSRLIQVPYEQVYGKGFEDMQRRVPSIEK